MSPISKILKVGHHAHQLGDSLSFDYFTIQIACKLALKLHCYQNQIIENNLPCFSEKALENIILSSIQKHAPLPSVHVARMIWFSVSMREELERNDWKKSIPIQYNVTKQ